MRRARGLALLGGGVALWLLTSLLSPFPTSPYELGDRIRAEDSIDASDVRLAVYGGVPHSYDATTDETLMYVAWCSHSLCAPLVRVPGDHRGGEVRGPWLLVPRGETLSFVEAPEFEERNATSAQVRDAGPAIDATFDIRSPYLPFLGRLVAGVLVSGGIGLVVRPRWTMLAPATLAATFASTVMIHASYVILVQLGGFLGVVVGAFFAAGEALLKRRVPYVGIAIALGAATMVALGLMALHHFPGDGGD